ncbi:FAD-binding oxidoreductase [Limobrevibacterium gyesilva]|uniref:FAD-binding oxidoreductase n=1 Tax=Limobrevibacterium gyesilva TaxID=2991712 RepID=A0AA41YN09_9PROT|nr:FAD-binding oxidoreductase [Limobrevibacterium gyesilva]MCW3476886.1 FAD-binding oxidoreductase [Limobrevibacterium gyesilva]
MPGRRSILSGWGNYPRAAVELVSARDVETVLAAIRACDSLIARGNGRAYGDAALNPRATLSMLPRRRIVAFDAEAGRLTCEAGALLGDIIDAILPRGWFVPVTPGTKFVTVGGMIAADVHGKNHHVAGSFGDHVEGLELALADGSVVRCSPAENAELFAATRGGMGLTGVILSATFRLIPIETAVIRQQTLRAANLEEVMALFERSQGWTYSVAWIDCLARGAALGRSLLYLGEHARRRELPRGEGRLQPIHKQPRRVPVDFPSFVLNRWSVRAFNELYFRNGRPGQALIDYDTYFYPLDALLEWNRIYGRSGFVQYQCVLPKAASAAGLTAILNRVARAGTGSFLAVLKLFGAQDGMLSFPMEGYTLALDFRATPAALALLTELDAIVADHGGRIYLAKDARTGAAMVRRGYPRLAAFTSVRDRTDPQGRFASLQSQRLGL